MRFEIATFAFSLAVLTAYPGVSGGFPGDADSLHSSPPAACGRCHLAPPPEATIQEFWINLIPYKSALLEKSNVGIPLTSDEIGDAVRYYDRTASPVLASLPPIDSPSPVAFEGADFGLEAYPMPEGPPAIGDLEIVDLDRDGSLDVVLADLRRHVVGWARPAGGGWAETDLARLAYPSAVAALDVDGDGRQEIAVSDLGSPGPTEDPTGTVTLLRVASDWSEAAPAAARILDGVAPVVGLRAADWDGDGDDDLLFASRGLFVGGEIGWLENTGGDFERRSLLARNGTEAIEVGDLDGDHRPDLVAVVGQEHEEILGFFGARGEPRLLYRAPHPLWSLARAAIADLDRDGDADVVFTNGLVLRAIERTPKPYHGVHWLENRGGTTFEHHEIAGFYAACGVAAHDLDEDGDVDIAATSIRNEWREPGRPSLIWLENDGHQKFTAHPLASRPTTLATAAIADLSGDGRADILAAGLNVVPPYAFSTRVMLWTNKGRLP